MPTMKGTNRLNKRLQKLIAIFFPECPRLKKYSVSFTDEMVAGSANSGNKKIKISKSYNEEGGSCGTSLSEDSLNQLLIHELCHISGNLHHGRVWQNEYERCLQIAKDRDLGGLAIEIEDDLRWYQDKRHIVRFR